MQTKKHIYILAFCLFCSIQVSFSQITIIPCDSENEIEFTENPNLALGKTSRQSSNYFVDGGFSSFAVDGISNSGTETLPSARTNFENQPWWEVDLGVSYFIGGVSINYNQTAYPQGLGDFYILFSDMPFGENSLNTLIGSEDISHIYVSTPIASGIEIQAFYQKARYVRIQMATSGTVSFVEIIIPGGLESNTPGGPGGTQEICNNGIDDDNDCKADCQDSECKPILWAVNKKDPSCKICNDGWIEIKAYGDNLGFSIDGGQTFYTCQPVNQPDWCGFDNLPVGEYNIAITNGICTTFWNANPVRLIAPPGNPALDNCLNGGFEEGDLTGWIKSSGKNTNSNYEYISMNAQFSSGAGLLTSGLIDPILGFTINAPIGNYFGRVGRTIGVSTPNETQGGSLKYKISVDVNNYMTQFYYYLVLQDGTGIDEHNFNPFFEWRILDMNNNVIQTLGRYTANLMDPLFTQFSNSNIVYKEWSCESLNLQAFIGQDIYIEFIGVNCDPGSHFGYAYIDGLCAEVASPYAELAPLPDVFCLGSEVDLTIENEVRFNQYSIELSRVDGAGNLIGTTVLSENIGFEIPDLQNIIGLYESKNSNYIFDCEDRWSLRLRLQNACGQTFQTVKNFRFTCTEYTFKYKDIIACLGNMQDIQMQGTTNCTGCQNYEWSIVYDPNTSSNNVGTYLDQPHAPYPNIKFSTNIFALGPTYMVKATAPEGCILSDIIRTAAFPDFNEQLDVSMDVSPTDVCTFAAETSFTFSYPVNSDLLDVTFYITSDYGQPTPPGVVEEYFESVLVTPSGVNTLHVFKPKIDQLLRGFDHKIRVTIKVKDFDSPDTYLVGTCSYSTTFDRENDSPFFGQVAVYIPSAFAPLNPNRPQLYFPDFQVVNGNTITHPNTVYEAWLGIWDRNGGGLIHEAHVVSTNNQPINPVDLAWDGKWNGQWVANGMYDVLVDYQNCQVAPSECFYDQVIIGPKLDFGDIGNGASIKPFHEIGITTNPCTPNPLSCGPATTIKSYGKCANKFHCNNDLDCHHKQGLLIAN